MNDYCILYTIGTDPLVRRMFANDHVSAIESAKRVRSAGHTIISVSQWRGSYWAVIAK